MKLYFQILIVTICFSSSALLRLQIAPVLDTISAGDSLQLQATVIDENNVEYPAYNSRILWSLLDSAASSLLPPTGKTSIFTSTQAYHTATIQARVGNFDGSYMYALSKTCVLPNNAFGLHLENDSNLIPLRTHNSLDSIYINRPISVINLVTTSRDKYGNFVEVVANATWNIVPANIISLTSSSEQPGTVVASIIDSGTCRLTVSFIGLLNDSLRFFVDLNRVKQPIAIPSTCNFFDSALVRLSVLNDSDAKIYFTVNNNIPDSLSGSVYTQSILLTTTTTIKAIAYKQGYLPSAVMSAEYIKDATGIYSLSSLSGLKRIPITVYSIVGKKIGTFNGRLGTDGPVIDQAQIALPSGIYYFYAQNENVDKKAGRRVVWNRR